MDKLLNQIVQILKCEYISDLHGTTLSAAQVERLWILDADSYTLYQWKSVLKYAFNQDLSPASPEKAREMLIDHLLVRISADA